MKFDAKQITGVKIVDGNRITRTLNGTASIVFTNDGKTPVMMACSYSEEACYVRTGKTGTNISTGREMVEMSDAENFQYVWVSLDGTLIAFE